VLRVAARGATTTATVQRACAALHAFVQEQGVADARVFAEPDVGPARGRTGKSPRVIAALHDGHADASAGEPARSRRRHS
jgi:hypothetical protein